MIGQSRYTKFKEFRFGPIFTQSLRISTARSVAQWSYYHIDLNAGSGINIKVGGVAGSPLNFISAVERAKRFDFFAFFIDHDPAAIAQLIKRPEIEKYHDRIFIFQADNKELLDVVRQFVYQRERNSHFAMGSILIDPNGYHKGVPWLALQNFCSQFPRFDLIMNLNTRTFRLSRPHILANSWNGHELHPVSSFPKWFNRPNWLITNEISLGGSSWIQLVGRTLETHPKDYLSLGYYNLKSAEGQTIITGLEEKKSTNAKTTISELPLLRDL